MFFALLPAVAVAQTPESQQLLPTDSGPGDFYGRSVAISGDTLAIGVPRDDDEDTNAGSVYLYTRTNGAWGNPQEIHAGDATADANFGIDVAVDGETHRKRRQHRR
jgi:hypothetical protein